MICTRTARCTAVVGICERNHTSGIEALSLPHARECTPYPRARERADIFPPHLVSRRPKERLGCNTHAIMSICGMFGVHTHSTVLIVSTSTS